MKRLPRSRRQLVVFVQFCVLERLLVALEAVVSADRAMVRAELRSP